MWRSQHHSQGLSISRRHFTAVYLLSHGVIKVWLIVITIIVSVAIGFTAYRHLAQGWPAMSHRRWIAAWMRRCSSHFRAVSFVTSAMQRPTPVTVRPCDPI
jgi:hypothetical protein